MSTDVAAPALDPRAVQDVLDGPYAAVRNTARQTLRGILFRAPDDLTTAEQRAATLTELLAVAGTGLPSLAYPEQFGGTGTPAEGLTVYELLAQADLSVMVKAGVQWGLFGGAVLNLGTEPHHAEYLPRIATGDLLGCFAMTETGHGSDVQSIRTTATFDPATDEFVVHTPDESARKDYIGNAAEHGRLAVVFAQLITPGGPRGPHAILVPVRDETGDPMPGVTLSDCGRKFGLNGVDNGRIVFDQVRVPRANLLNRYGDVASDGSYSSPISSPAGRFFTTLGTLVQGRVSVAGCAGAAARKALVIAVRYGQERRQFAATPDGEETRLLDHPAHQRTLLPTLARSYALQFAQNDLLAALDAARSDDSAQRSLEARAAGLKAIGTWHAVDAVSRCREACGGAGYLSENQLAGIRADLDVFTTFEGANTVLLQLAGKALLTTHRQHLGDLDARGTAGMLAAEFLDSLVEASGARSLRARLMSVVNRQGEISALRDPEWQLELFADRSRHLTGTTARRLHGLIRSGLAAEEAVAKVQDQLLRAARAEVEHRILESFAAAVEAAPEEVRPVLAAVRDLHVLSEVERDSAWFLQHDRLTVGQTKAVITAVDQLCGEIRPHAVALVDAFAVPQEWITAPILP